MGVWQKTLQRIRCRLQLEGEDYGDKKHGECARFDNGVCIDAPRLLNLTNLKPNGQACPHFKTTKTAKNEKTNTSMLKS